MLPIPSLIDPQLEILAYIEDYETFIWTDRERTKSDFEIIKKLNADDLQRFKKGYYIHNPESDHLCIINYIKVSIDSELGTVLKISGESIEQYAGQRIVRDQLTYSGSLYSLFSKLLTENLAYSSTNQGQRAIDMINSQIFTWGGALTSNIDVQYYGEDLYTIFKTLSEDYHLRWKFRFNYNAMYPVIMYLGKGIDRSISQTTVQPIVFSDSYENLANISYAESDYNEQNYAMVLGEGEGSNRRKREVWTGTNGSSIGGRGLKEIYIDGSSISKTVNNATVSDAEYDAMLDNYGKTEMSSKIISKAFDGEIDNSIARYKYGKLDGSLIIMYKYGEDYELGDRVSLLDYFGLSGDAVVSEYTWSYSSSEAKQYPAFRFI